MADGWKPALVALILLFIVGGVISPMIASIASPNVNDISASSNGLSNFVQNGAKVLGININPFGLFGSNFQNYVLQSIQGFALIPTIISTPLLIIITMLFVYGLIKLFLP